MLPTADSRTVDENTATDQPIGAPVVATDVDAGDSWTYSSDATSLTVFGIDTSTGQLKTKAALDHEVKDVYVVTVTARDSRGLTGSIDVTINVGDVNEAPEFPAGTATRAVAENTATDQDFGDPVEASDDDDGTRWHTASRGRMRSPSTSTPDRPTQDRCSHETTDRTKTATR